MYNAKTKLPSEFFRSEHEQSKNSFHSLKSKSQNGVSKIVQIQFSYYSPDNKSKKIKLHNLAVAAITMETN